MRRVDVVLGVTLGAAVASWGCAGAECESGGICGVGGGSGGSTSANGGAGGAGASGGSGGSGATGGAGGSGGSGGSTSTTLAPCDTPAPAAIPLSDLSEDPPVTTPDWSGELTWVEPVPAPSGGYEVEVYAAGCSSTLLSGFPITVPGNALSWAPPASGSSYRWRVRVAAEGACPAGAWSEFRPVLVPGAGIPVCPDTSPDPTFGTAGGQAAYYLPNCTYDSVANDVHMDPTSLTGEFYTAGRYYNGTVRRGYVMKHDAAGALVAGWGNGGIVDLGTPSTGNYVNTVVVDCDGVIHVGSRNEQMRMRVLRLTKDGAADVTFGGGAGEVTDSELLAASLIDSALMDLDPKGRYLVSGTKWTGADGVAVLSRFKASGELDPGFGDAGRVVLDLDAAVQDAAGPVKVQEDGKVLLAGYTAADYPYVTTTTASDLAVARVTTNGVLDAAFGTGGVVKIDISGTAEVPTNMAVQADGKILVIGVTNHTSSYTTPSQWVIARLTPEGALDSTFGSGGIVLLDPPFGGPNDGNDRPYDVVVRPDSTIWVAGQWGWNSGAGRAVVARLTPDGALDACFGTGGWYSVASWSQAASQGDSFNGMTQQRDGALLLVGGINPSAFGYAGLMRFKD